jgi:hypothetical protein
MSQLALQIVARRAYAADNFYLHRGVQQAALQIPKLLETTGFKLITVRAPTVHSGLTHFSIYLGDILARQGRLPRLIDAESVMEGVWARDSAFTDARDVVVLDDCDRYLKALARDDTGHFVTMVESIRQAGGSIILLVHSAFESLSLDQHVMSRVRSGFESVIEHPSREDMNGLIRAMARQRGVEISSRNVDFLARRLPTQIAALDDYFERVAALAQVSGRSIRLPLLSEAIGSLAVRY